MEEFTWVTPTMNSFKGTEIYSTNLDDFGAFRAMPLDLHAIMPNYLKTAEKKFFRDYNDFDEGLVKMEIRNKIQEFWKTQNPSLDFAE